MKIAIHHRPGSFSDRWIEYCKKENIDYKIVNAYSSDIVEQVGDCDAFMWHHHHSDYRDALFARQLIFSLETKGVACFPNSSTTWHFDDKVGQKYLLEAIGAPLVPSYVFYTKKEAMEWIDHTTFPKVFKLRGGAGASNVKLAHSAKEARNFVKRAFGRGFHQYDKIGRIKDCYGKWKEGKTPFINIIKGIGRAVLPSEFSRMHGREKGYVYFQDFIENNYFDIRIVVVADNVDKAFAIKRIVRKGDFRASGSGNLVYDKKDIPESCVKVSFDTLKKLKAQCLAFDYVFGVEGEPFIVEISYGFSMKAYDDCQGFWTEDMTWHEERFNPQEWMVKNLVEN